MIKLTILRYRIVYSKKAIEMNSLAIEMIDGNRACSESLLVKIEVHNIVAMTWQPW